MSNKFIRVILDMLSYAVLVSVVVLAPLFVDKNLLNIFIIPKQYVFIGLMSAAILLFTAKAVLSKKLEYRHSVLDWPIVVFLIANLISGILSINYNDSFFGKNEFFLINFTFLLFLAVYFFLSVNTITTLRRWRMVVDLMIAVGGVTALAFITKSIFNFNLFYLFAPDAWNTIDKLNSHFGIWMIAIFLLSAGHLLKKSVPTIKSIFYFIVSVLAFVSLILLGFGLLWWVLLIGLSIVLLLAVSFVSEARIGFVSALFACLVVTVIFIIFGTPKSLLSPVPSEVSLGFQSSWSIAQSTVFSSLKNFIFGSGLGTFAYDFSKFRPADFNYDSTAWSLRFSQPSSVLLAMLAEGGILLVLTFIFLLVWTIGHILQAWYRKVSLGGITINPFGGEEIGWDVLVVAVVWVVVSVGMAVLFYGPVLWWLWTALLGLTVVGLSFVNDHVVRPLILEGEDTPQYNLTFSFVSIIVIFAVVVVDVMGAKLYYAEQIYAQAIRMDDPKSAEQIILKAIDQRRDSDVYNMALAQLYLLQASDASQAKNPDAQLISGLMVKAVNAARVAMEAAPSAVGMWENLATMYENAVVIAPEARDWAIKTLLDASNLEPTNPVLWWRLGNNYSLSGKWDEAIKNYNEAIRLKQDYVNAYVGLANVYEQKQEIDKAVEAYKTIMPLALKYPDALFNYGRLLYNRNKTGDRLEVEKLWLEAVRIQPNYSNAIYSLGLLYEARGDKAKALMYYNQVKELNPENKDVLDKIKMLGGSL